MEKKEVEYLRKYYSLFMKYKVRTIDFFQELSKLSISTILLYKYAKEYIYACGTEEQIDEFEELRANYRYDEEATEWLSHEEEYKRCYEIIMQFKGDTNKIKYYCSSQEPKITLPVAKAKRYLVLAGTEEQITKYNKLKDTMYQSTAKNKGHNNVFREKCRELLEKKTIDEAVEFLLSDENMTPQKIYSNIQNYRTVNPDNYDDEEYKRVRSKLDIIYRRYSFEYNKSKNQAKKEKREQLKQEQQDALGKQRFEKLDNIIELIHFYLNGFLELEDLEHLTNLSAKEIQALLNEFDPELSENFQRLTEEVLTEKHNHLLAEIEKIVGYLRNGIDINGTKEEYTLYDFLISTDIDLDDLNTITDKEVSVEDIKLIKRFYGKNKNSTIYKTETEVYNTGFSYLINGEKIDITLEDKQEVIELLARLQQPLYKAVLTILFKRKYMYGITTEVKEYKEDVIELKKVQE